jgi:hypothetical protein
MDTTVLYSMMAAVAILMGMLPFAVFMGLATMMEISLSDWRVLVCYIFAAVVIVYVLSLGAFALIQKNNCGKLNMKQVAQNAGISSAFQAGMLLLVTLVPWFRNVVMKLMPPDVDLKVRVAVGIAYYSFWAALFGVAVGGSLSAGCAAPTLYTDAVTAATVTTANAVATASSPPTL